MSYDFTSLSPSDFEELTADLLSKEWGTRLEIYKAGKDQGVDLLSSRVPESEPTTVVQCKRYAPEKFPALLSSIHKERLKLDKLKPERYVLVTSVRLSKDNKEQLMKALAPYCSSTGDIYGPDELNRMLVDYPDVLRSHFKLWVSSTAVLERVLHAKIFSITEATVEAAMLEVRKLVPHTGLTRALDLLNEHHHVVICGNPGIGKTTLARMLLCHYLREEFEPVWVTGNIDEAWSLVNAAKSTEKKMVIIYDDFLGQLEFSSPRFDKNEEHLLFQLIDKVQRSPNLRFILTTREYILEDARNVHGAFDTHAERLIQCALTLDDFGRNTRGMMLFNHLFFSDLPDSRITKIVETEVYRTIVHHRNFNPRVVDNIAKNANSRTMSDDEFIEYIQQEFDNPAQLWKHPFEHEISEMSRQLLIALWSFDPLCSISSLQKVVLAMNPGLNGPEAEREFKASLRQLDGNFISTDKLIDSTSRTPKQITVVNFQNPSVREFVQHVATQSPAWLQALADTAASGEQIDQLIDGARRLPEPDELPIDFWSALRKLAERTQDFPHHTERRRTNGERHSWIAYKPKQEEVLKQLLTIERHVSEQDERREQIEAMLLSAQYWQDALENQSNYWSLLRFFEWLKRESNQPLQIIKQTEQAFNGALTAFLKRRFDELTVDQLYALARCATTFRHQLLRRHEKLFIKALECAIDAALTSHDSDLLLSEAESLDSMSKILPNNSLKRYIDSMEEEARRIEEGRDMEAESTPIVTYTDSEELVFNLDAHFRELLERNA